MFLSYFLFIASVLPDIMLYLEQSLSGNADGKMQISFVVHVPSMLSNKSFSGNTDASRMQKELISIFCASKKTKYQSVLLPSRVSFSVTNRIPKKFPLPFQKQRIYN